MDEVIHSSTEYDLFKPVLGNRAVSKAHVANLINSILGTDLTRVRPILVNEKLQIIDGQHRFEACKKLGKPIHYQIQESATSYDAAALNMIQKPWESKNYFHHLSANGDKNALGLKAFMEHHAVSMSVVAICAGGQAKSSEFAKKLRMNKLDVSEWDTPKTVQRIENWKQTVAAVRPTLPAGTRSFFMHSSSFIAALVRFMSLEGCKWEQFIKNISNGCNILPQRTIELYIERFIDAHNYRARHRLEWNPGSYGWHNVEADLKRNPAVYDSEAVQPELAAIQADLVTV